MHTLASLPPWRAPMVLIVLFLLLMEGARIDAVDVYGNAVVENVPGGEDGVAQLLEAPKISCEESSVKISMLSTEPFEGSVYAKGFFNRDTCRVQGNGSGNSANITIPISADCGMRRRRTIDPKGIVIEMTIVLMFHQKLLTKNDKAFHIECMYLERSVTLRNRVEVSMLPETNLQGDLSLKSQASIPKCHYEVLNERKERLTYATIGQPVYHRWYCQEAPPGAETNDVSNSRPPYCLTVHSCEVDDGHGSVQKLLDQNGCPVDKALLGPITYTGDLQAERKGLVFKFADKPTIYFSCQLRLEVKSDYIGECMRTSDRCAPPLPKASAQSVEVSSNDPFDQIITAENSVGNVEMTMGPTTTVVPTLQVQTVAPNQSGYDSEGGMPSLNPLNSFKPLPLSIEVEPSTQTQEIESTANAEDPPYEDPSPRKTTWPAKNVRNPRSSTQHDDEDPSSTTQSFQFYQSQEDFFNSPITDYPRQKENRQGPPRMLGGPSVEMDVNAPGLDVIDVPEIGEPSSFPKTLNRFSAHLQRSASGFTHASSNN